MKKILVVDDEVDVCDFVEGFFGKRGFQVLHAHNGKDSLPLIEKERPQIVLLDIRMPQMDGIATLAEIKNAHPDIEVIMVTCVDDLERMDEAKRLGAADYITKPLVLDELKTKVKSVLDKIKKEKRLVS